MTWIIAILGLGLVIFAHECGHYLGALLAGMRVKQFALGYGWRLCGWRRGGTDFRLNAIPFGGYVMVDGYDADDAIARDDPRQMQNRPLWARALFSAAGPLFSLVFALLVLLGSALILGRPVGTEIRLDSVQAGSPAAAAGLRTGDRLLAVNRTPTPTAEQFIGKLKAAKGPVELRIRRGDRELLLKATPDANRRLGIVLGTQALYGRRDLSAAGAAGYALEQFNGMTAATFSAFAQLFTFRLSFGSLSGPIGMVRESSTAIHYGLPTFLALMAFLSINLGLLNLLPIPALDGGRLLLLGLEKLGLKMSQTRQAVIVLAGFTLLFVLIVVVSIQDIMRIGR